MFQQVWQLKIEAIKIKIPTLKSDGNLYLYENRSTLLAVNQPTGYLPHVSGEI